MEPHRIYRNPLRFVASFPTPYSLLPVPCLSTPMRAILHIDTLLSQPQPLHRSTRNQVLRDYFLGIFRLHVSVPNRVRVNDDRWPVLALVQAAGFVDPHLIAQSRLAAQLLQPRMQLAFSVAGAAGPRRVGGALVMTDKYMALIHWQRQILRSNFRCFDHSRLTLYRDPNPRRQIPLKRGPAASGERP
jgi:hypothetical protein